MGKLRAKTLLAFPDKQHRSAEAERPLAIRDCRSRLVQTRPHIRVHDEFGKPLAFSLDDPFRESWARWKDGERLFGSTPVGDVGGS